MDISMQNRNFSQALDILVSTHQLIIDRPRGSAHPRYPAFRYPLDYGYLQGTQSSDSDGIDVWLGGLAHQQPTAMIVILDLLKHESEIKILLGCTPTEMQLVLSVHNSGDQSAMLIQRDRS